MLELNYIRDYKEEAIQKLFIKDFDAKEIFQNVISLDNKRKKIKSKLDDLLSESNELAKQIGDLYKNGEKEQINHAKSRASSLKKDIKKLQDEQSITQKAIRTLLIEIPNIAHESVPAGSSPAENKIVLKEGSSPILEEPTPHWEIVKKYDLIDFELGNKITGAGFPVYKGKAARLQRALINFFLDKNINAGYLEIQPPYLVNESSGFGTGQLPDKEGQMYHVKADNLYLIPTAEVPITNIFRDTIVNAQELPIKYTAYTPCFRREAGSYGKDVRGLNRLHQFDKVEIVQAELPEKSYDTLNKMVDHVKTILKDLKLPFRILKLCGGDTSFTASLTYDIEVYSAGQKRWLEVSSISNFESYQANRLKFKYKNEKNKNKLCHTLNGSALALPRIMAALLENNYTKKGIEIPEALTPYTGFEIIK